VPSYWGVTTDMKDLFHAAHSNNFGNLIAIKLNNDLVPTASTCVVSSSTPTFLPDVKN
jgi:hypothetical protein